MPTASHELPYEGAKEMILVDKVDDSEFLCNLIISMYDELPRMAKLENVVCMHRKKQRAKSPLSQ